LISVFDNLGKGASGAAVQCRTSPLDLTNLLHSYKEQKAMIIQSIEGGVCAPQGFTEQGEFTAGSEKIK
jgi:hypothetical protein